MFRAAYLQDGLGSVIGTTNVTGTLTANQRFDAWGGKTSSSGTIPQYGYTGREPDATGMVFYRNRYYHPTLGRFASRDPMGMADSVSPYAYVGNDPINFTDPTGEVALVDNFIGMGVNVLIGGGIRMATGGRFWDARGLAIDAGVGFATSGLAGVAAAAKFAKIGSAAKGVEGEALALARIESRGHIATPQPTFTANGARARADYGVLNPATGERYLVDAKNGPGASLTRSQQTVYPAIERGEAVARGERAAQAGFNPGKQVDPTRVEIMAFNQNGYRAGDYYRNLLGLDLGYQFGTGANNAAGSQDLGTMTGGSLLAPYSGGLDFALNPRSSK